MGMRVCDNTKSENRGNNGMICVANTRATPKPGSAAGVQTTFRLVNYTHMGSDENTWILNRPEFQSPN